MTKSVSQFCFEVFDLNLVLSVKLENNLPTRLFLVLRSFVCHFVFSGGLGSIHGFTWSFIITYSCQYFFHMHGISVPAHHTLSEFLPENIVFNVLIEMFPNQNLLVSNDKLMPSVSVSKFEWSQHKACHQ